MTWHAYSFCPICRQRLGRYGCLTDFVAGDPDRPGTCRYPQLGIPPQQKE